MKAYTLSILMKLAGKDEMSGQTEGDDIVNWVNNKVCFDLLHDNIVTNLASLFYNKHL